MKLFASATNSKPLQTQSTKINHRTKDTVHFVRHRANNPLSVGSHTHPISYKPVLYEPIHKRVLQLAPSTARIHYSHTAAISNQRLYACNGVRWHSIHSPFVPRVQHVRCRIRSYNDTFRECVPQGSVSHVKFFRQGTKISVVFRYVGIGGCCCYLSRTNLTGSPQSTRQSPQSSNTRLRTWIRVAALLYLIDYSPVSNNSTYLASPQYHNSPNNECARRLYKFTIFRG